ncbi:hypothetical protein GIB67_029001 [Kingdonia uniflora]|uniref:DNA topoisomerase I n=1 Tax=Kingdonia uniflora TaxID=39325 RepID=A0A7J7N6R3_9MAGN|nr:hypothetical protein GIB67_029001 [Kingdonia uniflora]
MGLVIYVPTYCSVIMSIDLVKPNYFDHDDDDDDDGPTVFKRSKPSSSKQHQQNSELNKSSSQKNDGSSRRQVPDTHSPNSQNSSLQRSKVVPSARPSTAKQNIENSRGSASITDKSKDKSGNISRVTNVDKKPSKPSSAHDAKPSTSKPNIEHSRVLTSISDKLKDVSGVSNMEKKPSKPSVKQSDDSDDSDDDKPLSSRLSTVSKVVSSPNPSSATKKIKIEIKSAEDSEDEIPLSSRSQLKSGGRSATKQSYDSDDEKPLASKIQQNGSSKVTGELAKSSKVLNKRPLSNVSTSSQSLVKKPKLSDASATPKVKQMNVKAESRSDEDDNENVPISQRMKKVAQSNSKSPPTKKTSLKVVSSSFKKGTKKSVKVTKTSNYSKSTNMLPSSGEGQKWTTLVHSGVIFPPPYKSHGVKMLYNGQPVDLTPEQEEVATMFAVMKDTEYATKQKFLDNFMNDWKLILGKNHVIKKFELCDFTPIYEWHQMEKEKKKQMTTDEKKTLKEEKMKQEEKYMWAIVDGVKEKVGNFRVEPPGLFRGRGEHPKMGKLKKRIRPSDITINIGHDASIPECPIPGQRWKEVKHDNTVTWLAFWNDPINPKEFKYVFLAASSSLKGQSDKEKYEKARLLKDYIKNIRVNYTKDFTHKDNTKRQVAVATYLIDKLALRAGNEKDDDEADTVGCCTLKVENVILVPPNQLQFDFLGKDSIRYFNTVEVELPVYTAIKKFKTGKKDGEDLFDELDTSKLNSHLKELMPGLTAKVFRTYNASITLDEMLNKETKAGDVMQKILVYQGANKEVAIICNHQRAVSKSHSAQMSRLSEKMDELKAVLDELNTDLARAKKGKPPLKDADGKQKKNLTPEALERKIAQTNVKVEKMEMDMKTKEDLKTVALGTSKINYLDPRISVAWCKRHDVPIEKIFNKSLLAKFAWAMDVDPDFRF